MKYWMVEIARFLGAYYIYKLLYNIWLLDYGSDDSNLAIILLKFPLLITQCEHLSDKASSLDYMVMLP